MERNRNEEQEKGAEIRAILSFRDRSSFLLEVLKTWFITHIRDENTWLHCENRTKNTKGPRHPSNIIYSNRMMLGILNYKGIASCGIKG